MLQDKKSLKPEYVVALEYLNAIFKNSNSIPDGMFDELRKHFSESEIVELTFLVGYINMLNWFNNALQVEYRGELAPEN